MTDPPNALDDAPRGAPAPSRALVFLAPIRESRPLGMAVLWAGLTLALVVGAAWLRLAA